MFLAGAVVNRVKNLGSGTNVPRGVVMATQAPTHIERVRPVGYRHLADLPVAGRAANPLVNMDGVIEVNEVGQGVDPSPLNRLILPITRAHRR